MKLAMVATLVALAGCSDGDGRFTGRATTTAGACGAGFADGVARASLQVNGTDALFTPSDGVLVLRGKADDKGHVAVQSTTPGADHKPFLQVFEGQRDGDRVSGEFATPRCRAKVELTRR